MCVTITVLMTYWTIGRSDRDAISGENEGDQGYWGRGEEEGRDVWTRRG